jgi:tetratricopeptide (TPR) repeat protein
MTTRDALQADLERYQASGNFAAQAETLIQLAKMAWNENEYSIAQSLYAQAWAAYEQMGDQLGIAFVQFSIGEMLSSLLREYGRFDEIPAEFGRADINRMYEMALAKYKVLDDKLGQAEVYGAMGFEAFDEISRARQCYQQSLNCYEMSEDVWGEAVILNDLADTYDDSHPRKKLLLERALRLYQHLGDRRKAGIIYYQLGFIEVHEKEYKQARALYETALEKLTQVGDEEWLNLTREALAHLINETPQQIVYRKDHEALFKRFEAQALPTDRELDWFESNTPDITYRIGPATTRARYQMFLMYCAQIGKPEIQCRLYWAWGRMEYCFARHMMSIALCQRAVMLFEHHFPHLAPHYQQQLDEMRQTLIESQNP